MQPQPAPEAELCDEHLEERPAQPQPAPDAEQYDEHLKELSGCLARLAPVGPEPSPSMAEASPPVRERAAPPAAPPAAPSQTLAPAPAARATRFGAPPALMEGFLDQVKLPSAPQPAATGARSEVLPSAQQPDAAAAQDPASPSMLARPRSLSGFGLMSAYAPIGQKYLGDSPGGASLEVR